MTVHHIGYLVKNIEKAEAAFSGLGYSCLAERTYDAFRDVMIRFMRKDGYTVELISPVSENSVVAGLMKKYKNSPYHICYETDDFDAAISDLERNGYIRIDEPCPAPAIGGRRVCFLQSARIGMIELLEA